mmetsp:Transcript_31074/g.99312  ORF Transcript_31074/g.99312 Transcript_31074/m.99312 type:complete len:205 (+) Transcript_31074:134-748(+)
MHSDPFAPTAEELAGEEPPGDETDPHTEGRACTRFAAPRAITPINTPSKLSQHQEPLADTSAQPTTPQEKVLGDEPPAAPGKRTIGFDQAQHYLLVFSQRAINKIFIRIDTSKANFEGKHAQLHQTKPPSNWTPPPPPPASPPKVGPTCALCTARTLPVFPVSDNENRIHTVAVELHKLAILVAAGALVHIKRMVIDASPRYLC